MTERILRSRKDLTKDDVKKLIDKKKEDYGGLLTDRGAVFLVASDLEISTKDKPQLKTELLIRDLITGSNDASVTGRVITIYPPQSFTSKDGKAGRLLRLVIADKSGTLRVNLWGDNADLSGEKKLELGQIVRVLHGYVKAGLDGNPELNLGFRGKLVRRADADEYGYPNIQDFSKKVSEINDKDAVVNFKAFISRISEISFFDRKGGHGKVQRFLMEDETGKIAAAVWNEKVDEMKELKIGDYVQIERGRTKRNQNGKVEIHVEAGSDVSKLVPPQGPSRQQTTSKISALQPGMSGLDVSARIIEVGPIRGFERSDGSAGRVSSMVVQDDTGEVRLTLWDNNTDQATRLNVGDVILIEDVYTKEGLSGKIELNLGRFGRVRIEPGALWAKH
jgi:replication factor A1